MDKDSNEDSSEKQGENENLYLKIISKKQTTKQ
jgi:hypothetical protein